MARRKKEEEPPAGLPAWMMTFSDLVTLLLTFFVMLMSVASFDDRNRVTALLRSLNQQMGMAGIDPHELGTGDRKELSAHSSADVSVAPMLAKLAQAFRDHLTDAIIEVDAEQDELRVDLPAASFFKEGSAEVHPSGYGLMATTGRLLAEEPDVFVDIHGYAAPEEVPAERNLAIERSVNTLMRLREHIEGERITAVAYGLDLPDPIQRRSPNWERRIGLVFRTGTPAGIAPATGMRSTEGPDGNR